MIQTIYETFFLEYEKGGPYNPSVSANEQLSKILNSFSCPIEIVSIGSLLDPDTSRLKILCVIKKTIETINELDFVPEYFEDDLMDERFKLAFKAEPQKFRTINNDIDLSSYCFCEPSRNVLYVEPSKKNGFGIFVGYSLGRYSLPLDIFNK